MTKEEAIKLVQSDFENVITYSQNYCQDIYSDKILDQWYENKKDFYLGAIAPDISKQIGETKEISQI